LPDTQNNESSAQFDIQFEVYNSFLEMGIKMFYYNRCNHAKEVPYAEANWTDVMNFGNALQDFNCSLLTVQMTLVLKRNFQELGLI